MIDGGRTSDLHANVVNVCLASFTVFGGPQLNVDADGDVHLVATERYVSGSTIAARAAYRRFDADLNEVDSGAFPSLVGSGTPDHWVYSPGVLTADGSGVVHTVARGNQTLLVRFDTGTGAGQQMLAIDGQGLGGAAFDGAGNLYAVLGSETLYRVASNLGSWTWNTPMAYRPWTIASGPDYVVVARFGLSAPSEQAVMKVSSSGDIEWTRVLGSLSSSSQGVPVATMIPSTETNVAFFYAGGADLEAQLRDANGTTVDVLDLPGPQIYPMTAAVDGQEMLLVGGYHEDNTVSAIARYRLDDTLVWSVNVNGLTGTAWVSSVATGPDGTTYIAGGHDAASASECMSARAWVARIEL